MQQNLNTRRSLLNYNYHHIDDIPDLLRRVDVNILMMISLSSLQYYHSIVTVIGLHAVSFRRLADNSWILEDRDALSINKMSELNNLQLTIKHSKECRFKSQSGITGTRHNTTQILLGRHTKKPPTWTCYLVTKKPTYSAISTHAVSNYTNHEPEKVLRSIL